MKKLFVLSLFTLMACAQPNSYNYYFNPAPPAPTSNSIAGLVSEYNQWRQDQGQESIIPGLSCTLYTVPTSTTAIIGATLTSVGSFQYTGIFNVPNESVSLGLPIFPAALQPLYQTWYIVKCTGFIVLPSSGYEEFDVSSDDGSLLYVNGSLLVNNDGLHSVQTVSAVKNLETNVYSFQLDYFQGGGNQSLIVNMNGALLPSANLYH